MKCKRQVRSTWKSPAWSPPPCWRPPVYVEDKFVCTEWSDLAMLLHTPLLGDLIYLTESLYSVILRHWSHTWDTLTHPHHLLVLTLLWHVVDDEPPLQLGVPGCPGSDEVLLKLTSCTRCSCSQHLAPPEDTVIWYSTTIVTTIFKILLHVACPHWGREGLDENKFQTMWLLAWVSYAFFDDERCWSSAVREAWSTWIMNQITHCIVYQRWWDTFIKCLKSNLGYSTGCSHQLSPWEQGWIAGDLALLFNV